MAISREEALAELYRRKALSPEQMEAVEELARRGSITLQAADLPEQALQAQAGDLPDPQEIARQDALKGVAEEVGPIEAGIIGLGRGFTTVGRGLGLIDPEDESEKQAYQALKEHRPYSTGAGEIVGEAAPFVALGGAGGLAARTVLPKLGSAGASALAATETLGGRAAASGTLGAFEGATLAAGKGQNIEEGALTGAAFGSLSEVVVPIVGKLAKSLYQKIKGITPEGALLDATGRPTPELQSALDEQNISFEDLTQQAQDIVSQQRQGAVPEQVARAAEFEQAGVRGTRGEITQQFDDQAIEARLLQSSRDDKAEPFRQYKLAQSKDIEKHLNDNLAESLTDEETGTLIKEALIGRKKLLRTEKNQLYDDFAIAAKDVGEIPIFTDSIRDAVPEADKLSELAITAGESVSNDLSKLLVRYGIMEPSEEALAKAAKKATQGQPKKFNYITGQTETPDVLPEDINKILEIRPLTAVNFDTFRKSMNAISKRDDSNAIDVAIGPIKRALDQEADELGSILEAQGFSRDITKPLKEARKKVTTLKTEFSPQSEVGKLVDVAKDGYTVITKASKVYSNSISAKSVPVENVRNIIKSLKQSGEQGEAAIGSLQTTTMLDIINAGFGTKSRKIDGVRLFNPIAFKNRMDAIGKDKLKAIFADNPAMINRLNNIDKISESLIKSADAEPKGSSSTILELMDKLQITALTSRIPLAGPAFNEFLQTVLQGQRTRREVGDAIQGNPEVVKLAGMFDETYPGIASALGISATTDPNNE